MIILSFVGLALIVLGFSSLIKNRKFMKKAKETVGNISEIRKEERKDTDEDGFTTKYSVYVPVIKFSVDGAEYTFKSGVSSRSKRKYKIGQEMSVSYNPENPAEAKIKSFMNDWIGPVVLVIVGVMLIILGFTEGVE